MNTANFLGRLETGDFVIVPGDRADVLIASLASALTQGSPVPGAMVLTDGIQPDPVIRSLLEKAPFPVFTTSRDTYSTARALSAVRSEFHAGQTRKIAAALGALTRHVNEADVLRRLALPRPVTTTPLRFMHELMERARSHKRRIVLAEGEDIRVLRAAEILLRRDACELVVLGDVAGVRELAASHGLDVGDLDIVDPTHSELTESFAQGIVRTRHPGLPVEGPIQYDAALDATIAASKLPSPSTVAGQATVFVFPDLNTGNNTYKAVEQSAGAIAVGPILQGLRSPINDLSRGSSVDDIVNTVAITAVQAQSKPGAGSPMVERRVGINDR
ncbi:phosphate acyltransferase [Arthrobacter sp. NyZ413]|uniref:phosphate acyltransferase n=1 Tax=Arthrobacter sp. NyZ413 TaxID=3144669 RepID=UPI003BF8956B